MVGMVTTPTPSDCVLGWSECFNGGTSSSGTTGSVCACQTDADCASYSPSAYCQNGGCYYSSTGPDTNSATVGSSGTTGCQSITGSTGTSGTSSTGQGGTSTPLVFIFDGQPVEYTDAPNRFELAQLGSGMTTAWPTARTPWLVLDRNGNGTIDDGRELFGSMSVLPDGRVAHDGFEALAAFDSNGDGVLDARDAAFADLRLWADRNQDRRSGPGELTALTDLRIESVSLRYHLGSRCDGLGNCEVERASFLWRDREGRARTGEVVDIHLANRMEPRWSRAVASTGPTLPPRE
jgi:hypothetical protein